MTEGMRTFYTERMSIPWMSNFTPAVVRNGVVLDRAQLVFDALNDPGFRTVGSVAAN